MNKTTSGFAERAALPWHWGMLAAICFCVMGVPLAANGQSTTVSDNFNDGFDEGWSPYDPMGPASGGGMERSFPADGSGGLGYRLVGRPGTNTLGLFQRGGSIRQEEYSDFTVAVDVINHDENLYGNSWFLGGRLTTPGALTTSGYIVAGSLGGPRSLQELMLAIQFTGEVNATEPDVYAGGASLMPYLPASRKLRMYFTGVGNNFISEIYDQTDLLEPIARSSFTDDTWPNGQSGVGFLNATLEPYAADDITYDNYYSTGSTNTGIFTSTPFIGFPGTPQVVNLKPKPQTLFYQPPANSNITFNVTTFTLNQINTNTLKMFLNGTDVTAQLAISPVGLPAPLGSPNTNFFVRYTGSLAPNTIYYGQIRVLDMSSKGTTNNWVFDTFSTAGTLIIEAEDYNYGGGQFQDNPPVSGLDVNNNQVNGGGLGYFDLQGLPCIDFNDLDRRGIAAAERQLYRSQDKVGTGRGRTVSADTLRPQYAASNLTDYVVLWLKAGEWMNYTRTFAANNYNVYLRASSQKAQALRLDEITSGSSSYVQTKVIRGEFLVPNTGGSTRYRYTPLTDGAGNLLTLNLAGVRTLRLTDLESSQLNALEAGDIQINYLLFVPAAAPPSPRLPWIAYASPGKGSETADPDMNVNISILNGDTPVVPGSIVLRFDGVNVTGSATIASPGIEGPGATIRYRPGLLLPKTSHTMSVVFSDNAAHTVSNHWSFTIEDLPVLAAADATGGSASSQFTVLVNKSQEDEATTTPAGVNSWPNDSFRAERQVAGQLINTDTGTPFANEAAGANNGFYTAQVINFNQDGNSAGFFGGDTNYPGIGSNDPGWNGGNPNHIAIAATIDLQLTNGVYAMGINSDDGYKVTAGGSGATNVYLGSSETFPASRDRGDYFTFVVQNTGVYRFRLLQWEVAGGASVEWWWVDDRKSGTGRRLINAPVTAPPTIPASYAIGSAGAPGFTIKMAKADNTAQLGADSARAESQLAGTLIDLNTGQPYANEAAGTNNGVYFDQTINFEQAGALQGFLCGDRTFPGIGPTDPGYNGGDPNNIAMAATALLQLSPGKYVFGVRSDDGFKVTTGAAPPYTDLVLGVYEGGRSSSESQFALNVTTAGLYPVRLLYYEASVGADCEFYSFDPDSGERVLINDPGNGNSIKAYLVPTVANVNVTLLNPRQSGSNFAFDFQTVSGKTYTVEYKNALSEATWTALAPSINGDGALHTVSYSMSPATRLYRLKVN